MFDGTKNPKETRMRDIYSCLRDNGIDAYFQGQHAGECVSPYTVIVSRGETKLPSYSSTETIVEVLCYFPLKKLSEFEMFVSKVKEVLKQLRPMLKNLHNDIGDYIDDDVKAVMRTLQYSFYCRIDD